MQKARVRLLRYLFWRNSTLTGNSDSAFISSIALGSSAFLSTLITRGESSAEGGFTTVGNWQTRRAFEYEELAMFCGRTVSLLEA